MINSLTRLFILCVLLFSSAQSIANNNEQLQQVKDKIAKQQQLLSNQKKTQRELTNALRSVETKLAKSAKSLHHTNQELTQVTQQQQQLLNKEHELATLKQSQQQTLSKQIKSAYMTGNNNVAQLILNQQKSSETQRLLGYYHFLNKARIDAIATLKVTLSELDEVKQQLIKTASTLEQLKVNQLGTRSSLDSEKKSRDSALAKLNKSYLKNSAELERFQLSEADIKQLIAKAQISKPAELNGLASFKRKLPRPSRGKTIHRYGTKRHGQLKWKGITINGKEGESVNAVHHGKVIYSDWIKGFGLVLVIDHGKGYMSLYGHNQALLKNAGDLVNSNEKIALLGQSGGQNEPGLYFEIRYKGKAVNPNRWLKR